MKSTTVGASIVLATVLATGCTKNSGPASTAGDSPVHASSVNAAVVPSGPETPEASIRTAIQAHLAHRGNLNLQSFDTEVKQVNIQGDNAQAQVEFHVKGGPGVMQLTYALAKKDNAWSVVESVPASSNFSHPPLDGSAPSPAGAPSAAGTPVDPMSDPTRFFKSAAPAQSTLHP
jgi:hypothetical protein